MNPFYDAHETSLSKLTDHDWHVLQNTWARGIDWVVRKLGKKWTAAETLFPRAPLFRTKSAAYDYVTNLVLAESHHRAKLQWEAEQCVQGQ